VATTKHGLHQIKLVSQAYAAIIKKNRVREYPRLCNSPFCADCRILIPMSCDHCCKYNDCGHSEDLKHKLPGLLQGEQLIKELGCGAPKRQKNKQNSNKEGKKVKPLTLGKMLKRILSCGEYVDMIAKSYYDATKGGASDQSITQLIRTFMESNEPSPTANEKIEFHLDVSKLAVTAVCSCIFIPVRKKNDSHLTKFTSLMKDWIKYGDGSPYSIICCLKDIKSKAQDQGVFRFKDNKDPHLTALHHFCSTCDPPVLFDHKANNPSKKLSVDSIPDSIRKLLGDRATDAFEYVGWMVDFQCAELETMTLQEEQIESGLKLILCGVIYKDAGMNRAAIRFGGKWVLGLPAYQFHSDALPNMRPKALLYQVERLFG